MELIKSHWNTDDTRVSMSMPISKIDHEKRLVSGWATLDNVDQSDDVVLSTASKLAFERFRGNIREMHGPIAAGRLIDFKEDSFYDSHTKKFYSGIYVTVYVSKGAQSTWEKVLDGTLSGFSIGGNIKDSEVQFVKDAGPDGKSVRFIKDYDLVELSLVDSPCNQLANVFSIEKNADASFIKGMVAETHLVNVFWCANDEIAKNSNNESETCLTCGTDMQLIGWFEKSGDEVAKVESIVTDFLRQKEGSDAFTKQNNNDANGEGGVDMTDEITSDAPVEDVVTDEVVTTETVATEEGTDGAEEAAGEETEVEAGAETEEAPEEVETEPDFEKMFDSLRDSVNKTLESNKQTVEKAVKAVEDEVAKVTQNFDSKVSEFEKSIEELKTGLNGIRTEREEVSKRLESLEKATAFKKSGEVETSQREQTLQKGLWAGTFFSE